MLSKSEVKEFAYCEMKGHKEIKINVLRQPDGTELGLIPMRVNGDLTSLQVFYLMTRKTERGEKHFERNGITRGAIFTIGNGSAVILCRRICDRFERFCSVPSGENICNDQVCFSAQNMVF